MSNQKHSLHISKWQGFSQAKCPRCRIGKVFNGPMYAFKPQHMNANCPACGLRFEREPGYFYVAMFVSYAMNVLEMITAGVVAYTLGMALTFETMWYFISVLFGTSLVLAPFNYRYSRMVLLYWLSPGLHYEPGRTVRK